MKRNIFRKILLALLLAAGTFSGSFAQCLEAGQNYWVVETNLRHRDYSIIRFYNHNNELLYEEKLAGIYLNVSRPRHVKRLNLALRKFNGNSLARINQKNLVASLYH